VKQSGTERSKSFAKQCGIDYVFLLLGTSPREGVLIHNGNYATDSEGCILVGLSETINANGHPMVTSSRETMKKLYNLYKPNDKGECFVLIIK